VQAERQRIVLAQRPARARERRAPSGNDQRSRGACRGHGAMRQAAPTARPRARLRSTTRLRMLCLVAAPGADNNQYPADESTPGPLGESASGCISWSSQGALAMSVFEMIVLGVAAALAGYGIAIYNRLVNLKHNVSKAWSNIDVLLKQRHDELPKLVATCKEYMKFEQETLDRVVSARSRVFQAREAGDVGALGAAEGALRMGLGQLFALAENYPDLKANQTFQHLQTRISGLENQIADRREFYNESVNRNNITIEEFPDLIVARLFNFREAQLLEFEDHEKADVNLGALFNS
jgi:LemA protein